MKTKYLVYIILTLLLGSLVAYRITKNKNSAKSSGGPGGGAAGKGGTGKDSAMPPINVTGVVLKTESFANSLSVSGSVEADEQVQIRSEIPGLVTGIFFKEGSNVSKGAYF
ncbi:MAG: hypothetical protein WBP45_01380 [Daejeonella sp.]